MVKKELVEYIKQCLSRRTNPSEIKVTLDKQGYSMADIEEAFALASNNVGSMNFFEKVKGAILSPKEFFRQIKSEAGIGKTFLFLVYISILLTLIRESSTWIFNPEVYLGISLHSYFFMVILSLVGYLVPVFIAIGFIHLFVKLFRGKHGFSATFKALVYPLAFSLIGSIIFFFLVPLAQDGMETIVFFILMLGLGLYMLQLNIWSLEELQELTPWNAFFAMILPLVILRFVVPLLISIGVMILFAFG